MTFRLLLVVLLTSKLSLITQGLVQPLSAPLSWSTSWWNISPSCPTAIPMLQLVMTALCLFTFGKSIFTLNPFSSRKQQLDIPFSAILKTRQTKLPQPLSLHSVLQLPTNLVALQWTLSNLPSSFFYLEVPDWTLAPNISSWLPNRG